MAFGSLGDWLGLLATTALAQQLSGGDYATANFAIAGVFIARLLPAVFLGPIAGVIADRLDRRMLMVVADVIRFALYFSIPIVGNYFWLYTATILVECVSLFWSPAKDASVPNLVPKEKLESANQVSLFAAYGTAPIAAGLFAILALLSSAIAAAFPSFKGTSIDIAPIPKFDDRFARQNRYEPPPEFPLDSPYSGIVHHLSGPNMYAHTQTEKPKFLSRRMVPV